MENRLTLGSLFEGSGGFSLGAVLNGITPVWSSEIEPFPIRVTTKRLPQVRHYGDVATLDGGMLEPVDIITFGSPCQDLSLAGKRSGLGGARSGLFYEAVRIVKEMRCKTDGRYPRFVVWENVPGAFSSNKGEDFRAVLEALCKVKDEDADVPMPEKGKWEHAGSIMGDGFSLAWRVLGAQYWGVPQRRNRIYLVTDFADRCAGKILFESEGVSGYSAEGGGKGQGAAGCAEESPGASGLCLNDHGGQRMDMTQEITPTLRAQANHPPCVLKAVSIDNHGTDSRVEISRDGIVQTLTSRMGTGGNNVPLLAEASCFDVRITSENTWNARANCYPTESARTLDTNGNRPDSNQGGVAVVSEPAYGLDRASFNQGRNAQFGFCIHEEVEPAMVASGANAVAYSTSKDSHHTRAERELTGTLVATDYKDPPTVTQEYIVRRLTPVECARLQGFPDWWCDDLATENPTEEDIRWWSEVFETYRKALGKSTKPRSDRQVAKWLKSPYTDSAAYKMWGNGVALPCVSFVLAGIVWAATNRPEAAMTD